MNLTRLINYRPAIGTKTKVGIVIEHIGKYDEIRVKRADNTTILVFWADVPKYRIRHKFHQLP